MELDKNSIHVWQIDLSNDHNLSYFLQLLSPDEQERTNRFHFEQDQKKYAITRGAMRTLLSKYLSQDPQKLNFKYSEHGKPSLADHPHLQFNASHSGDCALVAINYDYSLGVDIEQHKKDIDADGIIQRYFTSAEVTKFQSLNDVDKCKAFYKGWTCKEAFLKAVGAGLANSLQDIEVDLDPDTQPAIIAIHNTSLKNHQWTLYQIDALEDYSAALACNGPSKTVKNYQFNLDHYRNLDPAVKPRDVK